MGRASACVRRSVCGTQCIDCGRVVDPLNVYLYIMHSTFDIRHSNAHEMEMTGICVCLAPLFEPLDF